MNLYKQFIEKQREIAILINEKETLESDLNEIKRAIWLAHKERFSEKPIGKTTILDGDFEVSYDRKEKAVLMTEYIKKDEFSHPVLKEKTKTTTILSLDKTKYKQLPDAEKDLLKKYVHFEAQAPTLNVVLVDEQ
jgi:hypothetical protein